jgi:predicted  nucleic acid-binding Zn ribbon protein
MWQEDELELDYGLMDDEVLEPTNRVRGSSQKKNKSSPCPICPAKQVKTQNI